MTASYITYSGASGGGGTVTSVAMTVPSILAVSGSPITTAGTLAVTLATESANLVFAGPTTGSAATPTFRALVAADIPSLSYGTVTTVSVVSANGFAGTVANATTTPAITLSTSITGILKGNGTAISAATAGTDYSAGTSAASSGLVYSTTTTGTLTTGNLTGDVTTSGFAATLAATSNGTLTTLSGLTTASSLATVGTITSGTWQGTAVGIGYGGTGQTTKGPAFNALSPMTTAGDLIYGGVSGAGTRLGVGSTGNVLTVSGGNPVWAAPATAGTITALTGDVTASGSGSVAATLVATTNATLTTLSALTTAGSLATVGTITTGIWNGTTIALAHGGTGQTSAGAAFSALSQVSTSTNTGITTWSGTTGQALLSQSAATCDSSGNIATTGTINTTNATTSTTASTGAILCSGGISAVKNIVAGGQNGSFAFAAGNSGTSYTVNFNNSCVQNITLLPGSGSVVTFTFSNAIAGMSYLLILTQGTGAPFTVTWSTTVKWKGGTAPTLSTGAGNIDVVSILYDGTNYYGSAGNAFA